MEKYKAGVKSLVYGVIILVVGYPSAAFAQSSSQNYRVEESYFGSGGQVDASSNSYRARQSTGGAGGNSSSNSFDAVAGANTPTEPFLEMVVSGASVDFGTLDDTTTAYGSAQAGDCNCSFSVRSYLSSDYYVITASNPPTASNGESIDAKATLGAPSTDPQVEEFGINVVANTNPSIGANPVNQPDNSFADGRAADGYNTPNQFKYSLADVIARSPATSGNPGVGKTDYTISYIAKAKTITPAGNYIMNHTVIVVASY